MTDRFPAIFISHGSPTLVIDNDAAARFLEGFEAEFGAPKRILVASAHWETAAPEVSTTANPSTIHDFGNFAPELFEMQYPAPGAPELAEEAAQLLETAGFTVSRNRARGLDHGAWVPLKLMYPDADVPVAQLSIQPHLGARHHFELGRALRPLRDDGTLIMGSGAVTHNLEHIFRNGFVHDAPVPQWVSEFACWVNDTLETGQLDDLLDYRARAPHAARNHPSEEHFLPLLVALGAGEDNLEASRIHASQSFGALAMDAYSIR